MEPLSSSQFAERVAEEVERGHRFVVLAGAGLSLPSGIPTLEGVGQYLEQCIVKVLSSDGGWSPRTSKWPSVAEALAAASGWRKWGWIDDVVTALEASGPQEDEDAIADGEARLSAVGAMSNWQTALDFLTRVSGRPDGHLELLPPDLGVTDSLFTHVTEGRQPNAAHVMLAHLAYPLRIRTVLTTNFDDLMEQAFAHNQFPLTPFPVHHDTNLPEARLVLAQPSIVKLHGGRYGLRADVSLDEPPSPDDRKAFAQYFLSPGAAQARAGSVASLLVLGTSGRDERVLRLIRGAWRSRSIRNVFWVCYRKADVDRIWERLSPGTGPDAPSLFVVKHHHPGLLLLEVYQRTCSSLPPPATDLPAFWDVPADPYRPDGPDADESGWQPYSRHVRTLRRRIVEEWQQARESAPRTLPGPTLGDAASPRVLLVNGGRGLSSVGAEVYDLLCDERKSCIWLGLDDCCTPEDLEVSLVQAVARAVGIPVASPLSPTSPPAGTRGSEPNGGEEPSLRNELAFYLGDVPDPVIVFLNARDGFGTSAGTDDEGWDAQRRPQEVQPGDDLDRVDVRRRISHRARFCRKLRALRHRKAVFVLLLDSERRPDDVSVIRSELGSQVSADVSLAGDCLPFTQADVCDRVREWLNESPGEEQDRKRFLYALTLFRRSRYLAALCTWALRKAPLRLPLSHDRDELRAESSGRWLAALQRMKVVRTKPGGLIWMHTELRNELRIMLQDEFTQLRHSWECHQGIADWYVKLFRCTNDPLAALESVYHRLECVNRAGDCLKRQLLDPDAAKYAHEAQGTALVEAHVALKLCRDRVLASGYIRACEAIVDVVRGTAAGLRSPGDALGLPAAQLHATCVELLRDLAGSQGDFREALQRNAELREQQQTLEDRKEQQRETGPISRGVESQYRDAVYLTGLRSYDEAASGFRAVLQQMGFDDLADAGALNTFRERRADWDESDRTEVPPSRAAARDWVMQRHPSDDERKLTVRTLGRYMFLEMLVAQADRAAAGEGILASVKPGTAAQDLLQFAEVMYDASTEIMRYVEDDAFLQVYNAYIRTNYGVVLANFGRFSEAHRRLNEAAGYLRCSPKNFDPLPWAVVDLRRAEVYLRQAERHIGESVRTVAFLDSTHAALRQAASRFMGQPREAWWLTWMCELDLRVCQVLSRAGLCHEGGPDIAQVCRVCAKQYEWADRVAREALGLIRHDVFRQASVADILCRLKCSSPPESDEARRMIGDLISESSRRLQDTLKSRSTAEPPLPPLHVRISDYVSTLCDRPAGGRD